MGDAGADNDFTRAPAKHPTLDDFYLRPQWERSRFDAAHNYVADSRRADLVEIDDHNGFLGAYRPPIRKACDLGHVADDTRRVSIENAHDLAHGRLTHHNQIIVRAGRAKRLLDPVGHHQDGGEDENHQGDTEDRDHGGQAARGRTAQNILKRNLHLSDVPETFDDARAQTPP